MEITLALVFGALVVGAVGAVAVAYRDWSIAVLAFLGLLVFLFMFLAHLEESAWR